MRVLAIVQESSKMLKVGHYVGVPPSLTGGEDTRKKLSNACFVVLEENKDGVFLYRYGARGESLGDTWHLSIEDAKHQAKFEFGERAEKWTEIPAEVESIVAYGISQLESS